jgi:hypothetical protein
VIELFVLFESGHCQVAVYLAELAEPVNQFAWQLAVIWIQASRLGSKWKEAVAHLPKCNLPTVA